MKKVIISKNSQYRLIGKINGLAGAVKRARARVLKGKTEESRNNRAITKMIIGNDARHHLLAYAFVRGVPYLSVERKCRPENKPDAEHILQIVNAHLTSYEVKYGDCDVNKIMSWLKGEEIVIGPKKSLKEITKEWAAQNAV